MAKPNSFSEPERLSEIFDAPHREEWQNTSHILATLGLEEGSRIADVGAGTGYFSELFAEQSRTGKVYAIDSEPNMVAYMQNRFASEQHNNVVIRQCTLTDPCLPEALDVVFLANTYRFIQDRAAFLANLHSQIDNNTKVMFVDFRKSHARVSPEMAMEELTAAGFEVSHMDREGCPDHYIMIFGKSQSL